MKKWLKKSWLALKILFVSIIAYFILSPYVKLALEVSSEEFHQITNNSFRSDMALIEIAGRKFNMPAENIRGKASKPYFSYNYIWPNFYSAKLAVTYYMAGIKANDGIFSLSVKPSTDILRKTIAIQPEGAIVKDSDEVVKFYDLSRYKYYVKRKNIDEPVYHGNSYIYKDTHGNITDSIACYQITSTSNGMGKFCAHNFISKGIYYSLSYGRKDLPNWKYIKQKNIEFINKFEVK